MRRMRGVFVVVAIGGLIVAVLRLLFGNGMFA